MTANPSSRWLRWAVPGVVTAAVVAAAVVAGNSAGASQPDLPPKTAAQLLAAVAAAHPRQLSGTIVSTTNLGLPALPAGDAPGGGLSLQSMLTGSHTIRVWYGGPQQQRLALIAPMAERDVIHDGRQLWTYTSTTNTVTHSVLPSPAMAGRQLPHAVPALTPEQAAEQALRSVDPTTRVAVDRSVEVAGRAAYQLDLVPRDSRTLIGSVRVAIDAETSIPLRVQVFARDASSPAISVGFTDISLRAPAPSVFHFSTPSGASVAPLSSLLGPSRSDPTGHETAYGQPKVLGSGWTAVVEIPSTGPGQDPASTIPLLQEMSTQVPAGRLIRTPLVSALITPDGTVYVGSVDGASLQRVAATGHGL